MRFSTRQPLASAFVVLFCIFLAACSKPGEEDRDPPVVVPPTVDSPIVVQPLDTVVKGYLYQIISGQLKKYDIETGIYLWQKNVNQTFASSGTQLYYDSSFLYHRGRTGLSCYSAATGNTAWQYGWQAYSDAAFTSNMEFNDSLVLFSTQTSAWASSELVCLNKINGALKWKKRIDMSGWSSYDFFSKTIVKDGKVITLGRNNWGQKKLQCYNVSNGQLLWETTANDFLKANIKRRGNKIYSSGEHTYAYDLNTGALIWDADPGVNTRSALYGNEILFKDDNTLFVIGPSPTNTSQYLFKTLATETGAVSATFPFTSRPEYIAQSEYGYFDTRLYTTQLINDTIELQVYDMSAATPVLIRKHRPYVSNVFPIVSDKHIFSIDFTLPVTTDEPFYLLIQNKDGVKIRRNKLPGYNLVSMLYVNEKQQVFY